MPRFLRAAAFTVLPLFIWSQISWANPLLAQSGGEVRLETPQISDFSIPENLGKIQFEHPGSGPAIIHIQTAHGNYGAEQKIRDLLEYLKKRYGFKLLLVEGTASKLEPERLSFFGKEKSLSLETAEKLTREALMKGSELFLMEEPGMEAYGIENREAYVSNGEAFRAVLTEQKASGKFLSGMDEQINRLLAVFTESSFRGFLSEMQRFESGQGSLADWLGYLKSVTAKNSGLNLEDPANQFDWPMLTRFFKLQELEKKYHSGSFREELPGFLARLQGISPELSSQAEKLFSAENMRVHLPYPQTGELFEAIARVLPEDFSIDAYPNVKIRAAFLILQSELSAEMLMRETEKLSELASDGLARTEDQRKIYGFYRDYLLLTKLFALNVTPEEYGLILKRREALNPEALAEEFRRLNSGGRVRDLKFEHLAEICSLFEKSLEFYKGAKERDALMIQGVERRLKETGADKAVVITGGFHAEPFQDYFSSHGFNYARIMPEITVLGGRDAYVEAVLQSQPRLFFASTREVPFAFASPEALLEMDRNAYLGSLDRLVRAELETAEDSGDLKNIEKANSNGRLFGIQYQAGSKNVTVSADGKKFTVPVSLRLNLNQTRLLQRSELRVDVEKLKNAATKDEALRDLLSTLVSGSDDRQRLSAYRILTGVFRRGSHRDEIYQHFTDNDRRKIRELMFHAFFDPDHRIRQDLGYNLYGSLKDLASNDDLMDYLARADVYQPGHLNEAEEFVSWEVSGQEPRLSPEETYSLATQKYMGKEAVLFAISRRIHFSHGNPDEPYFQGKIQEADGDFRAALKWFNPEILQDSKFPIARAIHAALFEFAREEMVENHIPASFLIPDQKTHSVKNWRLEMIRCVMGDAYTPWISAMVSLYASFIAEHQAVLGRESIGLSFQEIRNRKTGTEKPILYGPVKAVLAGDENKLAYIAARSLEHKSSSGADIREGLTVLEGYRELLAENGFDFGDAIRVSIRKMGTLSNLINRNFLSASRDEIMGPLLEIQEDLRRLLELLTAEEPKIRGRSEELMRGSDKRQGARLRKNFEVLTEQTRLLKVYLDDRIAFANKSSEPARTEVVPVLGLIQSRHGQKLVIETSDLSGVSAAISRVRLFSILNNLVSNAIEAQAEYSQEPVTVRVSLEKEGILFEVQDHGPGFPSDYFQPGENGIRLFDLDERKGLGLAEVWATTALASGFLDVISKSGKGSTIGVTIPRSEVRTQTSEAPVIQDLIIPGVSAKTLGVSPLSRIKVWRRKPVRGNPSLVRSNDNLLVVEAKMANELKALDQIWARIVLRLDNPSAEEVEGMRVMAEVIERVKVRIRLEQRKSQEILREIMGFEGSGGISNPKAREIVEKELLPDLEDRDEFLFLSAAEEVKGVSLEKARTAITRRYQTLAMIKLYQIILNLPYGFHTESDDVIQMQRNLAASRKDELEAEVPRILSAIEKGSSPRAAVQESIERIKIRIRDLDREIKETPSSEDRTSLKTLRTIAVEQIGYLEKVGTSYDVYEYLYEPRDPEDVRKEKISNETKRHVQLARTAGDEFPELKRRGWSLKTIWFYVFSSTAWVFGLHFWAVRFFRKNPDFFLNWFNAYIRNEISKGRPVQYAAAKFFYENRELAAKRDSLFWPFLMRYYDLAEYGHARRESGDPVIVFAEEIHDESDYNRLMASSRGHGKIAAIVAPKMEGEMRIPHWFIYAKKENILVLTSLDLRKAGIRLEDLEKADGEEYEGMVDAKRGVLVINPSVETQLEWQSKGETYELQDKYYWSRARKQTIFNLTQIEYLADETSLEAIEWMDGQPSLLYRSGASGVGLFRLEELLTAQMDRAGIERDPARIQAAGSEILGYPEFENGQVFTIRLNDVSVDKRPQFLVDGAKGLRGWDMDEIIRTMSGARFYLNREKYPEFYEFGKMQLKAIFAAHLRKGIRRSGIKILISDVRNASEIEALEALLLDAKKEFIEEVIIGTSADLSARLHYEDMTQLLSTLNPDEISDAIERIPIGYMYEDTTAIENEREAMTRKVKELSKTHWRERFFGIGSNDLSKSINKDRMGGTMALDELSPLLVRDIWLAAKSAQRENIPVNLEGELGGSKPMAFILLALQELSGGVRITPVAATAQIPELKELVREHVEISDFTEPLRGQKYSLAELLEKIRAPSFDLSQFPLEDWKSILNQLVSTVEARIFGSDDFNHFAQQISDGVAPEDAEIQAPKEAGYSRVESLDDGRIREDRLYAVGAYAFHTTPNQKIMVWLAAHRNVRAVYGKGDADPITELYEFNFINILTVRILRKQKMFFRVEGPEAEVREFYELIDTMVEYDGMTSTFSPASGRSELRVKAAPQLPWDEIEKAQQDFRLRLADPSLKDAVLREIWNNVLNGPDELTRAASYYILADFFTQPDLFAGIIGNKERLFTGRVLLSSYFDPSKNIRMPLASNNAAEEVYEAVPDKALLELLNQTDAYPFLRVNGKNELETISTGADPRLGPGAVFSPELRAYFAKEAILFTLYRRLANSSSGTPKFIQSEIAAAQADLDKAQTAHDPSILENSKSPILRAVGAVLFEYLRDEYVENGVKNGQRLIGESNWGIAGRWRLNMIQEILGPANKAAVREIAWAYLEFIRQHEAHLGPETRGFGRGRLSRSELRNEEQGKSFVEFQRFSRLPRIESAKLPLGYYIQSSGLNIAVVDDHHKVVPIWREAHARGIIPKNSSLVHIDAHTDDLFVPDSLNGLVPLPSGILDGAVLADYLEQVKRGIAKYYRIGTFIAPEVLAGLIDPEKWFFINSLSNLRSGPGRFQFQWRGIGGIEMLTAAYPFAGTLDRIFKNNQPDIVNFDIDVMGTEVHVFRSLFRVKLFRFLGDQKADSAQEILDLLSRDPELKAKGFNLAGGRYSEIVEAYFRSDKKTPVLIELEKSLAVETVLAQWFPVLLPLLSRAKLITIATSPGYIDQDDALRIVNRLLPELEQYKISGVLTVFPEREREEGAGELPFEQRARAAFESIPAEIRSKIPDITFAQAEEYARNSISADELKARAEEDFSEAWHLPYAIDFAGRISPRALVYARLGELFFNGGKPDSDAALAVLLGLYKRNDLPPEEKENLNRFAASLDRERDLPGIVAKSVRDFNRVMKRSEIRVSGAQTLSPLFFSRLLDLRFDFIPFSWFEIYGRQELENTFNRLKKNSRAPGGAWAPFTADQRNQLGGVLGIRGKSEPPNVLIVDRVAGVDRGLLSVLGEAGQGVRVILAGASDADRKIVEALNRELKARKRPEVLLAQNAEEARRIADKAVNGKAVMRAYLDASEIGKWGEALRKQKAEVVPMTPRMYQNLTEGFAAAAARLTAFFEIRKRISSAA